MPSPPGVASSPVTASFDAVQIAVTTYVEGKKASFKTRQEISRSADALEDVSPRPLLSLNLFARENPKFLSKGVLFSSKLLCRQVNKGKSVIENITAECSRQGAQQQMRCSAATPSDSTAAAGCRTESGSSGARECSRQLEVSAKFSPLVSNQMAATAAAVTGSGCSSSTSEEGSLPASRTGPTNAGDSSSDQQSAAPSGVAAAGTAEGAIDCVGNSPSNTTVTTISTTSATDSDCAVSLNTTAGSGLLCGSTNTASTPPASMVAAADMSELSPTIGGAGGDSSENSPIADGMAPSAASTDDDGINADNHTSNRISFEGQSVKETHSAVPLSDREDFLAQQQLHDENDEDHSPISSGISGESDCRNATSVGDGEIGSANDITGNAGGGSADAGGAGVAAQSATSSAAGGNVACGNELREQQESLANGNDACGNGSQQEQSVRRRVKLYLLNAERQWDDKGTGYVSSPYVEALGGVSLVVRAEVDGSLLLESRVQPETAYQRQQGTLIVWSEGDNYDLALSFQERAGCDDIWKTICQIQGRDPSVDITQEVVESEDECPDGQAALGGLNSNSRATLLPAAEIAHLGEIAKILQDCLPFPLRRDSVATAIEADDYITKLLDVFAVAEDLEDMESLHTLYNIFKSILLLNKNALLDVMFTEENIMQVVGVLEYEPSKPRARHREYLNETATFHQVIPFSDPDLTAKIHQTYRVQYIQDVVLPTPSIFEENMLSCLSSFIFFNKADIVTMLQDDRLFLEQLFAQLRQEASVEHKRDLVLFLKEFCNFSQTLQPQCREPFFKALFALGILQVMAITLQSEDAAIKAASIDILSYLVDFSTAMVREYCLDQYQTTCGANGGRLLMDIILREILADPQPDVGVAVQLAGILRMLLDPETFAPNENKNSFLGLFYKYSMHVLTDRIVEQHLASPVEPTSNGGQILSAGRASLLAHIIEFLSFCVEHHGYHIKNYILHKDLLRRVLDCMKYPRHPHLALCALRFVRRIVGLKDDFYNRHITVNCLLRPVVDALKRNSSRYNLLDSAIIELFEFIRAEDIALLGVHAVEHFSKELDSISYVQTFRALRAKFEEQLSTSLPPLDSSTSAAGRGNSASGIKVAPDGGLKSSDGSVVGLTGVASSMLQQQSLDDLHNNRFKRDPRQMDDDEEKWFAADEDDPEDDDHAANSATACSTTVAIPASSLSAISSPADGALSHTAADGAASNRAIDETVSAVSADSHSVTGNSSKTLAAHEHHQLAAGLDATATAITSSSSSSSNSSGGGSGSSSVKLVDYEPDDDSDEETFNPVSPTGYSGCSGGSTSNSSSNSSNGNGDGEGAPVSATEPSIFPSAAAAADPSLTTEKASNSVLSATVVGVAASGSSSAAAASAEASSTGATSIASIDSSGPSALAVTSYVNASDSSVVSDHIVSAGKTMLTSESTTGSGDARGSGAISDLANASDATRIDAASPAKKPRMSESFDCSPQPAGLGYMPLGAASQDESSHSQCEQDGASPSTAPAVGCGSSALLANRAVGEQKLLTKEASFAGGSARLGSESSLGEKSCSGAGTSAEPSVKVNPCLSTTSTNTADGGKATSAMGDDIKNADSLDAGNK